jgi:hypothetical protein
MSGTLTAADAVLTFAQTTLFPVPQQLQGFSAENVFEVDAIQSAETLMGVDGKLSGGFVFAPVPMSIELQADSLSNDFFDIWWTSMQASKTTFPISGTVILPAISKKFACIKGLLTGYPPITAARKILQPRRFQVTWESITPSPV